MLTTNNEHVSFKYIALDLVVPWIGSLIVFQEFWAAITKGEYRLEPLI